MNVQKSIRNQIMEETPFDIVFKHFLTDCSRLQILQNTIYTCHEREKLIRAESQKNSSNDFASSHNMFYRNMQTNTCIFYDYRERSIEQLNEDVISLLNNQHQWVLIEAFECFEKFIEKCHIQSRVICPTLPERVRNKGLAGFLERFREHLPSLDKDETVNHRKINYRSAIALTEYLRHVSVHNGGRIINKEKFAKKLQEKVQQHNKGKHDININNYLNIFIRDNRGRHEINLLKIQNKKSDPINMDPLATIIDWLLTYSDNLTVRLNAWAREKLYLP